MKMHWGILVLLILFNMELTKVYSESLTHALLLKMHVKPLKFLMREFLKIVCKEFKYLPINLKA